MVSYTLRLLLFLSFSNCLYSQVLQGNILYAKDRYNPYNVRMEIDDPEGLYNTYDLAVNDSVYIYNEGLTVYVITNIFSIRRNEAVAELTYVAKEYPYGDYVEYPVTGKCVIIKNGFTYHYVSGIDELFQQALSRRFSRLVVNSADKSYVHIQGTPSDTWTINHNLNKYPCINVFNDNGVMIFYQYIEYVDLNTVVVHFAVPATGRVYLN